MNTNQLKRFAQAARKKLLDQVSSRLELILNTDSAELREKAVALSNLKQAINSSSKEQVIDKVAYTWFNRLMALRFMDANDYQPLGVRIVTPKDGFTLPEILEDTKQGQIPEELKVNRQNIHDLLDGKIPSSNAQNEVYKELLIGACNHLHSIFPFLFERIDDYTELLLPDDLTSEFSIINDFVEGMQQEDCEEVEVIGWLYQFYISERKDEVFASKSKVKKEDIPAATQLFTPRWIVEYMVQNTVGKLWLQNNPNSSLRQHMPYFIESPSVTAEDYLKVNSVEEITLLDQACGSGHILVYGFELLSKIYEEEGYNASEIPQLIIEKNLFGFEIDERAAQLAGFALMMKAREYHRRAFRKEIVPNILCFEDVVFSKEELMQVLVKTFLDKSREFQRDLKLLENATNYGSLIIPESSPEFLQKALGQIEESLKRADVFEQEQLERLKKAIKQLYPLSRKYHCIVDNPPYMGGGAMNSELSAFVKKIYPDSKADLMACFMDAGLRALQFKGFLGMINQHSWMFLSSYEKLRERLLEVTFIDTLLHLGPRTFPEIGGEVVQNASFSIWNNKFKKNGVYYKLTDFGNSNLKKEKTLEAISNSSLKFIYHRDQYNFRNIPEGKINYWFGEKVYETFKHCKPLSTYSTKRLGLCTGNNERFLLKWTEAPLSAIDFSSSTYNEFKTNNKEYALHNKGGEFRKWYGNQEHIIKFNSQNYNLLSNSCNKLASKSFYFKSCLSWSELATHTFGVRFYEQGYVFNIKGPSIFPETEVDIFYLAGVLNSNSFNFLIKGISNGMSINGGDVEKIPLKIGSESDSDIIFNSKEAIEISKEDWKAKEISWHFSKNELLRFKNINLKETYDHYKEHWKNRFFRLKLIEEEINQRFIEMYGLQDDLTPDVSLDDITILKEETAIINGEMVFDKNEIFSQFLSYAVGCMFGRYSLDTDGLILANQGETLEDYLLKIEKNESELTYLPDDDNIIPVLDDEWFEDDIIGRFYDFLKASFGKENFEKNLAFVEDSLGKDVRKYFVRDFYKDHIKRYKKRPIYWMFSSPKGSFNVLIYMHRYTPDTLNQILNGYLVEYREKLKSRIEHLDHIIETGSSVEQTKAGKEKDKLKVLLLELQEYEREILYPLATERISIDLDDGVLVNYNKFGKAIQEVKGLNDSKTKKKVRGFDWIDTEKII